MSNTWGDNCFMCGGKSDSRTDYGLLGPLQSIKEQRLICGQCINIIKKYRKNY